MGLAYYNGSTKQCEDNADAVFAHLTAGADRVVVKDKEVGNEVLQTAHAEAQAAIDELTEQVVSDTEASVKDEISKQLGLRDKKDVEKETKQAVK